MKKEEISISYSILTHNEHESLQKLLDHLLKHKDGEDEIVILDDFSDNKNTQELLDVYTSIHEIRFEQRHLLNDFADQKNYLKRMCKGDYVFNLDADELPRESLLKMLKPILKINPHVDLYLVPRINTVSGITLKHVEKWGWSIGKLEGQTEVKSLKNISNDEYELLKHFNLIVEERHFENGNVGFDGIRFYTPLINWPNDFQGRIHKNRPNIMWEKPVHEIMTGYHDYSYLPAEKEFCIEHHKDIKKQEKQNEFYTTL